MKLLFFAAFLAAAASWPLTNEQFSNQQWPWLPGTLYRYEVDSRTLAHLQEGPSSGNVFKAHFIVRVKAPGRLQARLEKPQHAIVHHQLVKDKLPEDLKYKLAKELEQPFEITLEDGRVSSMNMPSSLNLAQENLLKGLISTLQVDLSTHRLHDNENSYNEKTYQGQFKKMEADVTGNCLTLYTVLPAAPEWRRELPTFSLKEDPIVITKSKNYEHCRRRVAYHYGVPEGAEWTGTANRNREEQFIERTSESRILAGKDGHIFKSETTSTINVHPFVYGKQKAQVFSYVRLNLVNYENDKEAEWQKPEGGRVIKSLLYSMTKKEMQIEDKSSSSESNESEAKLMRNRQRRSVGSVPRKIVTINKIIIKKRSDNPSSTEDYSEEDHMTYMNDEIPKITEPAPAASYMDPRLQPNNRESPMYTQKLVQEMAQQLQNPSNMPKADFLSKFNILVRIISSMSYEQLSQMSRSIEVAKSSNNAIKSDMWMIYRDALAQVGTLPAFKQIQSWIQNKKIEGEEAAQIIATLPYTLRYPTKEVMIQFFKLAMSPEVSEQRYLNSTALIAATKFINMGQVDNVTATSYFPTYMYGRMSHKNDNFVLEEILPRLSNKLEQAIQKGDNEKAQVYIKSIGNLGHPAILEVLAPYLEGKIPTTTFLRTLIIDSLISLARGKDSHVRAAMYNILRNTAEPYEVRVAAIQILFVAYPTTAMMQAMAHMTHDDPSIHVRATLKSAIKNASTLKHPRYLQLARNAEAVRAILTEEKFGEQYSSKIFSDHYDREYQLENMEVLATTGSKDTLFPKNLKYILRSRTSGWNEILASCSSAQQLMDYFEVLLSGMMSDSPGSEPNFKYSAKKIAELLNIKRDSQNPLEASLYINLMSQARYFTLSENDLRQMPDTFRQLLSSLASGVDIHYTKVFNQAKVTVMFPVATGMPFVYEYKEPTVVHIQGKSKGSFSVANKKDVTGSFMNEIQFTFARNIDGRVGFLDTLSDQFASAGIVNKVQLNIPVKVEMQMKRGEIKIQLEPIKTDQDVTVAHYSVWPYTTSQNKDSLVTVSQDPNSKPIARDTKIASIDSKFGQSVGHWFQIQGYSYSSDYRSLSTMFHSSDLYSNIALALYQKDVALTHYNLRYLAKQSPNKKINVNVVYDTEYNKNEAAQPLTATRMQDILSNSAARRAELVKRVAAGINTATVKVVDLSATFEGPQKAEYILTAAVSNSQVDPKMTYALFAGMNTPQGNNQLNAVGSVQKPDIIALNFHEALKKDLKMKFDADIVFGQNENGNIHIQGQTERSKKYSEALQNHPRAKQCVNEIAQNNYYQSDCHKMIVMAHSADYMKALVTYKDVSPAVKYMIYRAYRIAENYGFWYTDVNPLKTLADGKLEIVMQNSYLDRSMNLALNSKYGEVRIRDVPIPPVAASVFSTYFLISANERIANYYTKHQFQPYCSVDGSKIKTFSNRSYDYTLSKSWHLVLQDVPRRFNSDELVVLARRPSENQQEIYMSYKSETGKTLEVEMKPVEGSKSIIKIKTDTNKVSEGDMTMYWDEAYQEPFLEYYFLPDGVLVLTLRGDRLKVMYDGQRLVVLTYENRHNTRGICGYMSGEPRDDYLTPKGLVDQPEHYGASYALNEEYSDSKTQKLQAEAQQLAYQPRHKFTNIPRADDKWQNTMEDSSEEKWGNQNVYRARGYSKIRGACELHKQVQYYENHGEICITMTPLDSCNSHCRGVDYKEQPVQVVCRPKLDQQFQQYRNKIRLSENPQVTGVPQIRQYRVPTSCII